MRKVFCSELTDKDDVWFLFENDEPKTASVTIEFKLEGYQLENPNGEDNVWSLEVPKGKNELRHMKVKPKVEKAGPTDYSKIGYGDLFDGPCNSFTYKATLSAK